MYSHVLVHVRFSILKTCFIDEPQIDKSHCLACNIHNSALNRVPTVMENHGKSRKKKLSWKVMERKNCLGN